MEIEKIHEVHHQAPLIPEGREQLLTKTEKTKAKIRAIRRKCFFQVTPRSLGPNCISMGSKTGV